MNEMVWVMEKSGCGGLGWAGFCTAFSFIFVSVGLISCWNYPPQPQVRKILDTSGGRVKLKACLRLGPAPVRLSSACAFL
jgi:hypothetical protein